MSGVPSSSRHPHSVVHRESRSSTRKFSSRTSYRPSRETTASRTSAMASSQHTDPNERSARRANRWATSNELGSYNTSLGDIRHTLNYPSTGSRAEDSERIISQLCWEIHDLRQEARNRSPAQERPRNRVNVSKRNNPEYSSWSPNSRSENYAETSCSQFESRSLTLWAVSKQPLKLGGHSRSRPPFHRRGGVPEQRNMFPEKLFVQENSMRSRSSWSSIVLSFFQRNREGQTTRKIHSSMFRSIQRPNRPSGPYKSLSADDGFVLLQWPPHVSTLPIKPWRGRTEMVQSTRQMNN